ncbi:hypothetical protein I5S53_08580 [Pseudomonas juntendi]|uniref:hypothetical protein n=1 Tax=Pseudomonas juntendi TaxID=2666183 RepID=UPI0018D8D126|nr:hypothetical protein [Pseudomonas juntendi]MBH3384026.1 hypothetical protein [Pseudomonas juntendi]MDG9918535.1 hypothetical protein [Pseudomonas juntendi]MDH0508129.1 hypothetical protein [Pseudomonas juntendi]MDH1043205.1 hypothetical protein [Pseudomonas juntendi]
MTTDCQALADVLKQPFYRDLLLEKGGYKKIDQNLLRICSDAIRQVELNFPLWNDFNRQRHAGKFLEGESLIKCPSLPPHPRPYRSWAEFRMSVFGAMQEFPYERLEVDYYVKKTHRSDWYDIENNRIWYQGKGVITSSDAARDLKCASEQNNLHQVFIFTVPNIHCPWSKPRVDGSVMTQEEWATKEGFDYTYEHEIGAWLRSERHKYLVENFGRNLPQLSSNKGQSIQSVIAVNSGLFAHKQQQQRVTIN